MAGRLIRRRDRWPLAAATFVLAVSGAWWAFALWSVPGAPAWVERARSVCFNLTESGLPDVTGWMLLVGGPPILALMLWVGWRDDLTETARHVLSFGRGRVAMAAVLAAVLAGLGLAGARVADARLPDVAWGADGPAPAELARLDRAWPLLAGLVDQTAAPFTHERLAGRRALVTFAFGHCETLCPVVVQQVRAARTALDTRSAGGPAPAEWSIVVLTVDPWRDTPSRLGALLAQWGLDPARDFVVGGSVEAVGAALEAWSLPTARDGRTGDILHPGVVYLAESDGTLAYASTGGIEHLVSLGAR